MVEVSLLFHLALREQQYNSGVVGSQGKMQCLRLVYKDLKKSCINRKFCAYSKYNCKKKLFCFIEIGR